MLCCSRCKLLWYVPKKEKESEIGKQAPHFFRLGRMSLNMWGASKKEKKRKKKEKTQKRREKRENQR